MFLHVRAGGLASATPERFPALAEPRSTAVPRGYTCQRPITLGDLHWLHVHGGRQTNAEEGCAAGR